MADQAYESIPFRNGFIRFDDNFVTNTPYVLEYYESNSLVDRLDNLTQYLVCVEQDRLLYTQDASLYEYGGKQSRFLSKCDGRFAVSPNGHYILLAERIVKRKFGKCAISFDLYLLTPSGRRRLETYTEPIVPLFISDDACITSWAIQKSKQYHLYCYYRTPLYSIKFDKIFSAPLPHLSTDRTGSIFMFCERGSDEYDTQLHFCTRERGFLSTRGFPAPNAFSTEELLQIGSCADGHCKNYPIPSLYNIDHAPGVTYCRYENLWDYRRDISCYSLYNIGVDMIPHRIDV